jgi:acetyl-CoA carboxylase biotin carboxyl carrier protein
MSEPDHVLGLVDDLLRLAQGSAATTIEVESDGLSVKVTRRLGRDAIGGGVGDSSPSGGGSRERGGVGGSAPTMSVARTQRIHAPTVGIFNTAREWSAGDAVARGDVLGGIQSLGHVADITAPADGEIKDVLVAGGAPVEYGQPLFVIALR